MGPDPVLLHLPKPSPLHGLLPLAVLPPFLPPRILEVQGFEVV